MELRDVKNRLDNATEKKLILDNKLKMLKKDYEILENESRSSYEYLQRQEVKNLRKKYTRPLYVYLEKFPSNNTGKKNSSSLATEQLASSLGMNTYEIDDFKNGIVPDFEDIMLYNLFNKKNIKKSRILVHTLYGSSNKIFELLVKRMYCTDSPYVNDYLGLNILLCSIKDIELEFEDVILKCSKET